MSKDQAPESARDDRRLAILEAGFETFAAYGYRRSSMEDIAKAAQMSRAALYLHFRNKADIFRSLLAAYFDQAEGDLHAGLNRAGSLQDKIEAGFRAVCGPAFQAMMESPHGQELMDGKDSLGADLVAQGEARLLQVWSDWLLQEAAQGRLKLDGPPEEMARVLMAALHGIKEMRAGWAAFDAALIRLAGLMARGLSA